MSNGPTWALGVLVVVVLVFFVADRVLGATVAAVVPAAFATLSLSPRLLFSAAYAEHFVLPPVLAGVLVLPRAIDCRRMPAFFGSGLLFGTAFLMKQSGGAFLQRRRGCTSGTSTSSSSFQSSRSWRVSRSTPSRDAPPLPAHRPCVTGSRSR